MWEVSETKTVKARKEYDCNAAHRISNSDLGEIDFEAEDWLIIQKAKAENWKIKKGDLHIFTKGKFDGEFTTVRARIDLNKICEKYEIYTDY